jgi:hypothetical protein
VPEKHSQQLLDGLLDLEPFSPEKALQLGEATTGYRRSLRTGGPPCFHTMAPNLSHKVTITRTCQTERNEEWPLAAYPIGVKCRRPDITAGSELLWWSRWRSIRPQFDRSWLCSGQHIGIGQAERLTGVQTLRFSCMSQALKAALLSGTQALMHTCPRHRECCHSSSPSAVSGSILSRVQTRTDEAF